MTISSKTPRRISAPKRVSMRGIGCEHIISQGIRQKVRLLIGQFETFLHLNDYLQHWPQNS